jgi:hypothetical protein
MVPAAPLPCIACMELEWLLVSQARSSSSSISSVASDPIGASSILWLELGLVALLVGGLVGVAVGAGLAALWNQSDLGSGGRVSPTGRIGALWAAGAGLVIVVLGVVIFWLPVWFNPLFYVIFGGH